MDAYKIFPPHQFLQDRQWQYIRFESILRTMRGNCRNLLLDIGTDINARGSPHHVCLILSIRSGELGKMCILSSPQIGRRCARGEDQAGHILGCHHVRIAELLMSQSLFPEEVPRLQSCTKLQRSIGASRMTSAVPDRTR